MFKFKTVYIDSNSVATFNSFLGYLNIGSGTEYYVTNVYINKETVAGTLGIGITDNFTKKEQVMLMALTCGLKINF